MLALLLLIASAATAQRYTFSNYGLESGLSNGNVTALLEAHSGFVWVGTQKGVFKANGTRFEAQQAFADAGIEGVWAMCEDNEGRIWAVDGSHLAYWEDGRVHAVPGIKLHILSVKGVDLVRLPGQPDAIYLLHDLQLQRIASKDHGQSWQLSDPFGPALRQQNPELD